MDDGLKQRLVGAFVLLALAVIFVPVFFDRERIEPVSKKTQIPIAPHIEPLSVKKAEPPVTESPAKNADEMYLPDENDRQDVEPEQVAESTPAPTPNPTPVSKSAASKAKEVSPPKTEIQYVDAQGVPKGWVLQVASFKDQDKAQERRDELIKLGYAAYTKDVKTSKGQRTRLYVGPKLDKNVLVKQKRDIDKKYSVDSLLLKFKP